MRIQKVNAVRLNPAAYNPRRDLKPGDKDYEKLKRSIEEFGFVEPVVWNEATGNVVGGHQRLKVLLDMGETKIDCVVVDLGPEQEKALNLALNRIQGGWDETKLAEVMADLDASAFDVSLTGFDAEEVDALMNKFYSAEATEDDFDREKAAAEIEAAGGAITKPGDLWELGSHRLYCGDPAQTEAFDFLMGSEQAACAMTAPPVISTAEYKKDGLAPWLDRMAAVIANLCRYAPIICWNIDDLFSTGSQYVEPTGFFSMKLFSDYNFRPLWIRVWKKQGALARVGSTHQNSTKPQRQFEYVAAFAGEEAEEINQTEASWVSAFASHNYRFVKRLTKEERRKWGYAGVWEMAAPQAADGVVQLPVELPWRCMKMHSDPGAIVVDPFCGGGTTLIAAEQSGRRCFAMDTDPAACDLAVMRWEQFTGEKARRVKK
ncbi:ParB N-terminal domain-containing protein [Faecalimonas umbilicata]|nr:ParB N-terminal domain-containing protein [Faecalimonas umbilicata]